jgi:hypothetical protein
MDEFYKQFYDAYAPDVKMTDEQLGEMANLYKGDLLRFVNDFEANHLKPNNEEFNSEIYDEVLRFQNQSRSLPTRTTTATVSPEAYQSKPQGINDWLQIEERKSKNKLNVFQESNRDVLMPALTEKYGGLGFEFHGGWSGSLLLDLQTDSFVAVAPNDSEITINPSDKDSVDKFAEFVTENMPSKDSPEYKKYLLEVDKRINLVNQVPTISDEEISNLEEKYRDNENLFDSFINTSKIPIQKEGLSSGALGSHSVSSTVYPNLPSRMQHEVDNIFKEAKQMLSVDVENPTEEQIEELARRIVYQREKQRIQNNIITNFVETLSEEDRVKYNIGVREEYQDQDAEYYASDQDQTETELAFFEADPSIEFIERFEKGELLPEELVINTEIKLVDEKNNEVNDEIIELKNGMKVPLSTFNKYVEAKKDINVKANNLINKIAQLEGRYDKINNAGDKIDVLKRDFDTFRNSWDGLKQFFQHEIGYGTVRLGAMVFGPRKGAGESFDDFKKRRDEYTKRWDEIDVKMQDYKDIREGKRKRPPEFEDVKLGENFGDFFWHELSQFLPIVLTMGGIGSVTRGAGVVGRHLASFAGMSIPFAGGRRRDYSVEEARNPYAIKRSENYKALWSFAHGAAEGFWETLTTFRLIRRAQRAFGEAGKRGMRENLKYFYTNMPETLSAAATGTMMERYGEGATQLTQNWIDERPWIEGLDHSMFVGMMFGGGMSLSPIISGYIGAKFSDAEVYKKVNELNKEKLKLQGQYESMDKRTNVAKALKKQIDLLDGKIDKEIRYQQDKQNDNTLNENEYNEVKAAVLKGFEIREEARELLEKDTPLTDPEKILLELYKVRAETNRQVIEDFIGGRANHYDLLEASNPKKHAEILDKAREQNRDATEEEIKKAAEDIYYGELSDNDVKKQRNNIKNAGLNTNLTYFKTKDQAVEYLDELIKSEKITKEEKENLLKIRASIKSGKQNGWNTRLGIKGYDAYIVKENAVNNRKPYTASHEVGHTITWSTLMNKKEAELIPMATDILEYLKHNDKKSYDQIVKITGKENFDPTEVLSEFFELVGEKQIKNYGEATQMLSLHMEEALGISLRGGKETFDFIEGLAQQLVDGTLTKKSLAEARKKIGKNEHKEAVETKSSIRKDLQEAYQEARDTLNPEAAKYKDNWTNESADKLWVFARNPVITDEKTGEKKKSDKGIFDSWILGKKPGNMSREEIGNYLYDSYVELLASFRSFNPSNIDKQGRPDLFGWIMGVLGYKTLNVKKKKFTEDKKKAKQVELDKAKDLSAPKSTSKVKEEVKDNFAEEINMDPTTISGLIKIVTNIIGTYKDTITKGATKNVTITPIMRAVNNALTAQYGAIIKYIRTLPGKTLDVQLKFFLKKNAPQILNKAKTAYLSKNFPSLVLKSVGGKYKITREVDKQTGEEVDVKVFIPKWVDHTVWNKKGVKIDKERSAETGRTSGLQLMKKDQNAIDNFDMKEFVNYFFKDGKPIQNKYEGLAKELAQRLGRAALNNDLLDKGPISQRFQQTQELYDRVVNENFASVLIAQSDLSTKSSITDIVKLSQNKEQYEYFKEAFKLIAEDVANGMDPYAATIKRLMPFFKSKDIRGTDKRMEKLAKGVKDLYSQYSTISQKAPDDKRESFESFEAYFTGVIDQLNYNDVLSQWGKRQGYLSEDVSKEFSKNIEQQQVLHLEYGRHLVKTYGLEEALRILITHFKGHTTTAGKTPGKRNQAFGKLASGEGNFVDTVLRGISLDIVDIKIKSILYKKDGVNMAGEAYKKGDVKSESIESITVIAKGASLYSGKTRTIDATKWPKLNSITGSGAMKVPYGDSKTESKEVTKHLKELLKFTAENYSGKQFVLLMASLNSNQSTMLRRAAVVRYIYEGPKFKSEDLLYEHMIQANYMAVKLSDYYLNDAKIDLDKLFKQYTVSIIPKKMADLIDTRYKSWMPLLWKLGMSTLVRYYNTYFYNVSQISKIKKGKKVMVNVEMFAMKDRATGRIVGKKFTKAALKGVKVKNQQQTKNSVRKDKQDFTIAMRRSADINAKEKGASFIDFDDTLATSDSKVIVKMKDGEVIRWTPAEFAQNAETGADMIAEFDFSEFYSVKKGKKGPFFNKAKSLQEKYGNDNMFILTARPQEAALAIQTFLQGVGLNIKLENIIGLEDGRPEAKAKIIVQKAAEGYNNFLFADDQIKNVKAVSEALDVLDVNGKVYKLRTKHSKTVNPKTLDTILDENNPDSPVTGIKKLTDEEARHYGKPKPWYKILLDLKSKTNALFVPPSAEDLKGLWNNHIAGKGKKGEADILWFEETIIRPYARGERAMDTMRLYMVDQLSSLYKIYGKDFKKKLKEKGYSGIFTMQDAVRMYIWDKLGYDIPGNQKEIRKAINKLMKDQDAKTFADQLLSEVYTHNNQRYKVDYAKPTQGWMDQGIDSDVTNSILKARKNLYKEFLDNKNKVFTKENMNKIEAIYGKDFRVALEDIFYRMESGVNRSAKDINNFWIKWLNAGVGNIMFVNIRSALLQVTSFTNFIDIIGDNNPMSAMARFIDFPQFKKDLLMLWNSNFLKARRLRGKTDVAMNEILEGIDSSQDFFWKIAQNMLQLGYKPTQLGDSFAIALGGAAFYRNRYNTYIKQGKTTTEAHNRAMRDLRERAEEVQQSARADLISQQQASVAGRVFLSFQNITMQYTRIAKKLYNDIKNKRRVKKPDGTYYNINQSRVIQLGRIGMYLGYQHLIFQGLQQAILAMFVFNDDDDEPISEERKIDYLNGALDAIMRGMGIAGGVLSVVKNIALQVSRGDSYRAQNTILDISPSAKTKYTKAKKIIRAAEKGNLVDLAIETPSFLYGLPTDRVIKLIDQIGYGTNLYGEEYEKYQRVMLLLGWSHWNFYDKPPKGGIVNYMKNIGEKSAFDKLSKKDQEMIEKLVKDLE